MINPEIHLEPTNSVDLINYYYFHECLTSDEFSNVINICDNLKTTQIDYGIEDSPYRKSKVGYIEFSDENKWLYQRLYDLALIANEDMGWNFDVDGISENIEYREYHDNGGYYMWHSDLNENSTRKISMSLSLSTLNEYEGGNHHIFIPPTFADVYKDVNSLIIYPSYMFTRTTPIMLGVKRELKIWLSGKSFK